MTGRLLRLLVLCCALLAVTGCRGAEPEPRFSPSPAPPLTTAPTSSPPTTASVDPVLDTPRGVVRRWIRLYNQLLTDGDGAEIRTISRTCEPCLAIIRDIETIYTSGGFFSGGAYSIRGLRPAGFNAGVVGIRADLVAEASRFRRGPDGPAKTFDGGPSVLEFDTRRDAGKWSVDYLVQVKK